MAKPVASEKELFNGCLAEVEAGYFVLPREAAWFDEFRNELRAFPHGKHDDQFDSFSQFVRHQMRNWRWILTERNERGRVRNLVSLEKRPW